MLMPRSTRHTDRILSTKNHRPLNDDTESTGQNEFAREDSTAYRNESAKEDLKVSKPLKKSKKTTSIRRDRYYSDEDFVISSSDTDSDSLDEEYYETVPKKNHRCRSKKMSRSPRTPAPRKPIVPIAPSQGSLSFSFPISSTDQRSAAKSKVQSCQGTTIISGNRFTWPSMPSKGHSSILSMPPSSSTPSAALKSRIYKYSLTPFSDSPSTSFVTASESMFQYSPAPSSDLSFISLTKPGVDKSPTPSRTVIKDGTVECFITPSSGGPSAALSKMSCVRSSTPLGAIQYVTKPFTKLFIGQYSVPTISQSKRLSCTPSKAPPSGSSSISVLTPSTPPSVLSFSQPPSQFMTSLVQNSSQGPSMSRIFLSKGSVTPEGSAPKTYVIYIPPGISLDNETILKAVDGGRGIGLPYRMITILNEDTSARTRPFSPDPSSLLLRPWDQPPITAEEMLDNLSASIIKSQNSSTSKENLVDTTARTRLYQRKNKRPVINVHSRGRVLCEVEIMKDFKNDFFSSPTKRKQMVQSHHSNQPVFQITFKNANPTVNAKEKSSPKNAAATTSSSAPKSVRSDLSKLLSEHVSSDKSPISRQSTTQSSSKAIESPQSSLATHSGQLKSSKPITAQSHLNRQSNKSINLEKGMRSRSNTTSPAQSSPVTPGGQNASKSSEKSYLSDVIDVLMKSPDLRASADRAALRSLQNSRNNSNSPQISKDKKLHGKNFAEMRESPTKTRSRQTLVSSEKEKILKTVGNKTVDTPKSLGRISKESPKNQISGAKKSGGFSSDDSDFISDSSPIHSRLRSSRAMTQHVQRKKLRSRRSDYPIKLRKRMRSREYSESQKNLRAKDVNQSKSFKYRSSAERMSLRSGRKPEISHKHRNRRLMIAKRKSSEAAARASMSSSRKCHERSSRRSEMSLSMSLRSQNSSTARLNNFSRINRRNRHDQSDSPVLSLIKGVLRDRRRKSSHRSNDEHKSNSYQSSKSVKSREKVSLKSPSGCRHGHSSKSTMVEGNVKSLSSSRKSSISHHGGQRGSDLESSPQLRSRVSGTNGNRLLPDGPTTQLGGQNENLKMMKRVWNSLPVIESCINRFKAKPSANSHTSTNTTTTIRSSNITPKESRNAVNHSPAPESLIAAMKTPKPTFTQYIGQQFSFQKNSDDALDISSGEEIYRSMSNLNIAELFSLGEEAVPAPKTESNTNINLSKSPSKMLKKSPKMPSLKKQPNSRSAADDLKKIVNMVFSRQPIDSSPENVDSANESVSMRLRSQKLGRKVDTSKQSTHHPQEISKTSKNSESQITFEPNIRKSNFSSRLRPRQPQETNKISKNTDLKNSNSHSSHKIRGEDNDKSTKMVSGLNTDESPNNDNDLKNFQTKKPTVSTNVNQEQSTEKSINSSISPIISQSSLPKEATSSLGESKDKHADANRDESVDTGHHGPEVERERCEDIIKDVTQDEVDIDVLKCTNLSGIEDPCNVEKREKEGQDLLKDAAHDDTILQKHTEGDTSHSSLRCQQDVNVAEKDTERFLHKGIEKDTERDEKKLNDTTTTFNPVDVRNSIAMGGDIDEETIIQSVTLNDFMTFDLDKIEDSNLSDKNVDEGLERNMFDMVYLDLMRGSEEKNEDPLQKSPILGKVHSSSLFASKNVKSNVDGQVNRNSVVNKSVPCKNLFKDVPQKTTQNFEEELTSSSVDSEMEESSKKRENIAITQTHQHESVACEGFGEASQVMHSLKASQLSGTDSSQQNSVATEKKFEKLVTSNVSENSKISASNIQLNSVHEQKNLTNSETTGLTECGKNFTTIQASKNKESFLNRVPNQRDERTIFSLFKKNRPFTFPAVTVKHPPRPSSRSDLSLKTTSKQSPIFSSSCSTLKPPPKPPVAELPVTSDSTNEDTDEMWSLSRLRSTKSRANMPASPTKSHKARPPLKRSKNSTVTHSSSLSDTSNINTDSAESTQTTLSSVNSHIAHPSSNILKTMAEKMPQVTSDSDIATSVEYSDDSSSVRSYDSRPSTLATSTESFSTNSPNVTVSFRKTVYIVSDETSFAVESKKYSESSKTDENIKPAELQNRTSDSSASVEPTSTIPSNSAEENNPLFSNTSNREARETPLNSSGAHSQSDETVSLNSNISASDSETNITSPLNSDGTHLKSFRKMDLLNPKCASVSKVLDIKFIDSVVPKDVTSTDKNDVAMVKDYPILSPKKSSIVSSNFGTISQYSSQESKESKNNRRNLSKNSSNGQIFFKKITDFFLSGKKSVEEEKNLSKQHSLQHSRDTDGSKIYSGMDYEPTASHHSVEQEDEIIVIEDSGIDDELPDFETKSSHLKQSGVRVPTVQQGFDGNISSENMNPANGRLLARKKELSPLKQYGMPVPTASHDFNDNIASENMTQTVEGSHVHPSQAVSDKDIAPKISVQQSSRIVPEEMNTQSQPAIKPVSNVPCHTTQSVPRKDFAESYVDHRAIATSQSISPRSIQSAFRPFGKNSPKLSSPLKRRSTSHIFHSQESDNVADQRVGTPRRLKSFLGSEDKPWSKLDEFLPSGRKNLSDRRLSGLGSPRREQDQDTPTKRRCIDFGQQSITNNLDRPSTTSPILFSRISSNTAELTPIGNKDDTPDIVSSQNGNNKNPSEQTHEPILQTQQISISEIINPLKLTVNDDIDEVTNENDDVIDSSVTSQSIHHGVEGSENRSSVKNLNMFDINNLFDDVDASDSEESDYLPEVLKNEEIDAIRRKRSHSTDSEDEDGVDELPDLSETPRSKQRRLLRHQEEFGKSMVESEQKIAEIMSRSMDSISSDTSQNVPDWIREYEKLVDTDAQSMAMKARLRNTEVISNERPEHITAILEDTTFSDAHKKHGPSLKRLVKEKLRDEKLAKMEESLLHDLEKGGFRQMLENQEQGSGEMPDCDDNTRKALDLMKQDWGSLPAMETNSKIFIGGEKDLCVHKLSLKSYFTEKGFLSLDPDLRGCFARFEPPLRNLLDIGTIVFLLNQPETRVQTFKWILDVFQCHLYGYRLTDALVKHLQDFKQSAVSLEYFKMSLCRAGIDPNVFDMGEEDIQPRPAGSICEACLQEKKEKTALGVKHIFTIYNKVRYLHHDSTSGNVEFAVFLLLMSQDAKFNIPFSEIMGFIRQVENWDEAKFLISQRLIDLAPHLNVIKDVAKLLHFKSDRCHELARIIAFSALSLYIANKEKTEEFDANDLEAVSDIFEYFNVDDIGKIIRSTGSDGEMGTEKRAFYYLSLLLPLLNICIGKECRDHATFTVLDRIWGSLRSMNKKIRDNGAIYRSEIKFDLSLFTRNLRLLTQQAPKQNKASIFKYLRSAPVEVQMVNNSCCDVSESEDEANFRDADLEIKGKDATEKTFEEDDEFRIAEDIKNRIINLESKR